MHRRFISLQQFTAGRLVPLDKGTTNEGQPGVRHVGVGEVLHRLSRNLSLLMGVIKDNVMTAAGPLQTCTGITAGIEAIHAMRQVFEEEDTDAIILVDAENAFNNLNRCPSLYRYLHNTYQSPAKLVIPGKGKYDVIYSEEGCTQGDGCAMAKYGIVIRPLSDKLTDSVDPVSCKQICTRMTVLQLGS